MKTENTTIETKLYRKVDGNNSMNFGELCFSTEKSISLCSHGEFCLVLSKKSYTGIYADGDIDANKNFGYDEFRIEMNEEELKENIEEIVVPDSWFDSEEAEIWIENLRDIAIVTSESNYCKNENVKINFNF